MEYSESLLTDLYFWLFSKNPDTIINGVASSTDGINVASINQVEMPDTSLVWCVGGQSEFTKITAFEVDLTFGIDNFKQAWTNRDNLP